nr:hypothetical protein [Massilia sp. BJB1822]
MQQRLVFGQGVEIPRLPPQLEILQEHGAGAGVAAQLGKLIGQQVEPAERQAGQQHQDQGGKQAADARAIKAQQAEVAARLGLQDQAGDQETGNDEKHIDAGKTARQTLRHGMEEQDGQDGKGT